VRRHSVQLVCQVVVCRGHSHTHAENQTLLKRLGLVDVKPALVTLLVN
jgi:hypothetical protein